MTYNFLQNGSLHILKVISTNEEIKAAGLRKNNNHKYLIKERRRLFFPCRAHNQCVQILGCNGGKKQKERETQKATSSLKAIIGAADCGAAGDVIATHSTKRCL